MPYSTVNELPTQVRGALDPEDQRMWLETFNAALGEYGDERSAFRVAWHAVAKGDGVRYVSGWASVELVDKQREKAPADILNKEINDTIWNYGLPYGDVHSNRPVGAFFDSEVGTHPQHHVPAVRVHGVVYKGQDYYDAFWNDVTSGRKGALSVGIMKIDHPRVCEDGRCWEELLKNQHFEISGVPSGACPGAELDHINFRAKSDTEQEGKGMKMDKEAEEKGAAPAGPAAAPGTAEKAPMGQEKAETPPAQAPAAGEGALAEWAQKMFAMLTETQKGLFDLQVKVDQLAGHGVQDAAPKAQAAAPEPDGDEAAPEGQDVEGGSEPKDQSQDAPEGEPKEKAAEEPKEDPKAEAPAEKPEEKPEEQNKADPKAVKCKCSKAKLANKADVINAQVAKQKELRNKAETEGAVTPRPDLMKDKRSVVAAIDADKTLQDLMRSPELANMSTAEWEKKAKELFGGN